MLKKALKISLIISFLGAMILVGAFVLTRMVKKEIKKAETTVPENVEFTTPEVISEKKMAAKVKKKLKKNKKIYTKEYQKAAKSVVEKLKKKGKYTIDSPLLIMNPYGTNKTGLYIYFRHFLRVNTKYNVTVKSYNEEESNIPDFSASMYTNLSGLPLAEQEGQIIGLMEGKRNYVSVYLYDENEKMIAKAGYRIELPKGEENVAERLEVEHDRDVELLSDGLFAVFERGKETKSRGISLYDNHGILRAKLPVKEDAEVEGKGLNFLDGKLFYPISEREYALVNHLGFVERIFNLGKNYRAYGNFDVTPANRYMLTFARKKGGGDGSFISLDLYNGKVKELMNVRKLLPEEFRGRASEFGTVRSMNDDDILIGEKRTSSVIRVNNVFRRPSVKMILSGRKEISSDRRYEKEGDFVSHLGQTSITTDRFEKIDRRRHHIDLFNTNSGGGNSTYYKYLIDDNHKKYQLAEKIEYPYRETRGWLSRNEESMVVSFGEQGIFEEYNMEKNRLAKFTAKNMELDKVIKFNMKGSWFSK